VITSSAGGLVPNKTAGLHDFREETDMSMPNGEAAFRAGAQNPDPAPNQKGHQETGGQVNDASTGRNGAGAGGNHGVSGTVLPETTGAGQGTVRKGGRGGR
jgi:hypothetical protein